MSGRFCTAHAISFSYPGQIEPLFNRLSLTIPQGWTGVVGANGAGKSTLARLLAGELSPTAGTVERPNDCRYCAQSSDGPPSPLYDLLASSQAEDLALIRRLGIGYDWPYRWDTLSYGERRRAHVGSLLFEPSEMMIFDEPTNHLDADAAAMVGEALSGYDGIGVIISHDRDLLDRLCDRCLFLRGGGAELRTGGVSAGLAEAEREARSAIAARQDAKRELERLKQEAARRRREAQKSHARSSKRRIAVKDHDAKGRIDLARVSGKDAVAGRLARRMDARVESAASRLQDMAAPVSERLGVTLHGAESRSDALFHVGPMELPLGEASGLFVPELSAAGSDRIAITGPNGSGKSTCVRTIVAALRTSRAIVMPQELSRSATERLSGRLADAPHAERADVLSAIKRLGSEPERFLETRALSPGEARKLFLAFGLREHPEIIILDEPTNHMDLPSIRCLEEALDSTAAALLFVTHDGQLAERLALRHWRIVRDANRDGWYRLSIE